MLINQTIIQYDFGLKWNFTVPNDPLAMVKQLQFSY